jgi:hypothetical protein
LRKSEHSAVRRNGRPVLAELGRWQFSK